MNGVTDRTRLLATARAGFLDGADAALRGVPDHVAASWRRSASSGVQPYDVASDYHPELDWGSRLVRCAEPVLEQLVDSIAGLPMCVALTDERARILTRRDSSSWIGRLSDAVYFARGFDYAEGAAGTNGVGTVLESGHAVHIVGAEHFVETLQVFACSGAPIRDPFTGRIAGVLDISCRSEHATPLMHSLVRTAAHRIEQNLLLDRNQVQQALFDAYSRLDARTRQAVIAVGPRVVMANPTMQNLLDPGDQEALHDHLRFVMARADVEDQPVELPSGTWVRLRGSVVRLGADVGGMVGTVSLLEPAAGPERTAGPRRPAAGVASCSPAWRAAAAEVQAALDTGAAVLVLGEPGTGRYTLVADLHRARAGPDTVVTVPAAQIDAAPVETAARLSGTFPATTLFVLRNLDRVTPAAAESFAAALRPGTPLAGTAAEPTGADAVPAPLTALFHACTTLPPLRHRGADLPGLARSVLADLAPRRDVRLTRDALRVLGNHPWPGNVAQLREALAAALTRRPVGSIEAQDLPEFCQSAPRRRLRHVDEVERDAIVAALRESGGNRVAAAAALGFARSTLYRKVRQYGITD